MKKLAWLGLALASVLVACPPSEPTPIPISGDADNDNIPDNAEIAGGNFNGIDVYAMGARTGQRDIFLEIDNMTSAEAKLNPQRAALDKFVAAFATKGIALHIDVGDAFSPNFDPANYNLGNSQRLLPYNTRISLKPTPGYASVQEFKNQYFATDRNNVFYYMVLGSSQNANGSAGSSGRAEIIGDESMVTFGGSGWNLNTSTPEKTNQLNNIMASTMMHEFGHNLGLRHGGNENKNYKPNYVSIMNYMYQLDCIGPTTGTGIADRFFRSFYGGAQYPESGLVNNARSSNCKIDFSDGGSSNLNETSLNENNGMGRGAGLVDWNNDGTTQSTLNFNLNNENFVADGDAVSDTMQDHNDWGSLQIGFPQPGARPQAEPELSHEDPPSPAFFKELGQ
jgi:hypothetical protein